MPSRRAVFGTILAVVSSGIVLGPIGHVTAAAANPITFAPPTVMDPIHTFGEPDLGIDNLGRHFSSGPAGTGTQRSPWMGSVDDGQTFRVICANGTPSAAESCNQPPGGGDTEIVFDNHNPPGQYFSDLYALACFRTAATPDGGKTVSQSVYPGGCPMDLPTADRQWQVVYDPAPLGIASSSLYGIAHPGQPLVYLTYTGDFWNKSTDGVNYTQADGGTHTHSGGNTYPAIDQVTGKVFKAFASGGAMKVNVGTPDANGDLTFLDGASITAVPSGVSVAGGGFTVLTIDSARNLYVIWTQNSGGGRVVMVSGSSAASGWTAWTTPLQVSDGTTTNGDKTAVFSWGKGGGPGQLAAVWYGDGSNNTDPSSTTPHVWNVFLNRVQWPVDANGGLLVASTPTTEHVKVTPHPMDYFDICLAGTGCITQVGNRNLADFFEVQMDNDGAIEVVYDDMSNGLIQNPQPGGGSPADHPGAPMVTIARQNGGPGLKGVDVTGRTAAPIGGIDDPAGDALYPVIQGANQTGLDLMRSSLSLSGSTLKVTMKVANLNSLSTSQSAITGASQIEYVTRWQLGNNMFYANAYMTGTTATARYSAGPVRSIDLCSVSACDPHVLLYPEGETTNPASPQIPVGSTEPGSITCPASPGPANPCTITINVSANDIGGLTDNSTKTLESVGAYALAVSHPQVETTNAQAQGDSVPLVIDGVCCYNYAAGAEVVVPEFPAPMLGLLGATAVLFTERLIRRRRRSARAAA